MSKGVATLGALSAGHYPFGPRPNDEASSNVFVNGKGVIRVGDHWALHAPGTHDGVQAEGSSTVYVNGKAIARIGDAISCGDFVAEGSSNVFAG